MNIEDIRKKKENHFHKKVIHIKKRANTNTPSNFVVFTILAITLLILGLTFIKGSFQKTETQIDTKISEEQDPGIATSNTPITLSRETIKALPDSTETLKIRIFNPTESNWTFRDAIRDSIELCGKPGDNICYISTGSGNNLCNNDINAIANDIDCHNLDAQYNNDARLDVLECTDEGGPLTRPPEGICFIDNINCPKGTDPDCAPNEGVRLEISCSNELNLTTETNPKTIESQESATFVALLDINMGTPKGSYLCEINIIGQNTGAYTKDLVVKI